jgi:predicted RND superfamily exporter protein
VVLLGAMAVLGYAVKPSTILVLSIAFGIAVDDTIHLLGRVVRHARPGEGIASGLADGLRDAGPVMIVTTGIVSAGFLLLTASHFTVLALIGFMTALSAFTALVADLFVLPSLVSMAESPAIKPDREPSPTQKKVVSSRAAGEVRTGQSLHMERRSRR